MQDLSILRCQRRICRSYRIRPGSTRTIPHVYPVCGGRAHMSMGKTAACIPTPYLLNMLIVQWTVVPPQWSCVRALASPSISSKPPSLQTGGRSDMRFDLRASFLMDPMYSGPGQRRHVFLRVLGGPIHRIRIAACAFCAYEQHLRCQFHMD